MSQTNASPHSLNNRHYIKIWAPRDGADRWKAGGKIIGALQTIADKGSSKLQDGLGLFSESAAAGMKSFSEGFGRQLDNLGSDNGIPLMFKSYITEIPGWNIQNDYGDNLLARTASVVIGGATKLAAGGGLTPNLNTSFQLPKMWKGQAPLSFSIDTIITPDTLSELPAEYASNFVGGGRTDVSPGAQTVVAALIGIMVAAPRQFSFYTKAWDSVNNLFLAAPPVIDLQIGPFTYPTVRVKGVDVTFPKEDNYYDINGFPTIAKIRFTFQMSMTFTQENWSKMATSIMQTGRTSLYADSFLLKQSGNQIGRTVSSNLEFERKRAELISRGIAVGL